MLKKMRRTQFFEHFVRSDNMLITNILHTNSSFLSSNALKNQLTFKFLFRHTFQVEIYTLFNISSAPCCLFFRFPLFLFFQRAVLKFSAHSERISTALQIKLQCAVKKKTVRWKFENLVLFFKRLFTGDK